MTTTLNHAAMTVLMALMPDVSLAQDIEGLYRPDQAWAETWTCDPDDLGMDGGALGILDGKLFGLEKTCDLTDPRESNGGTQFTAVCSAEGETYTADYFFEPTESGVRITRDGETLDWRRCGQQAASFENVWVSGFAMGVVEASIDDGDGSSLTMSCQDGANGQVYLNLSGQPATDVVRFDVDGQIFELPVWAEGGRLNVECRACSDNYMALWVALRSGTQVIVSDATNLATLSLEGSSEALSPEPCVPEGW